VRVRVRHSGQPGGHDLKFYFPKLKYRNEYVYG
jgi:hypothetical protein